MNFRICPHTSKWLVSNFSIRRNTQRTTGRSKYVRSVHHVFGDIAGSFRTQWFHTVHNKHVTHMEAKLHLKVAYKQWMLDQKNTRRVRKNTFSKTQLAGNVSAPTILHNTHTHTFLVTMQCEFRCTRCLSCLTCDIKWMIAPCIFWYK